MPLLYMPAVTQRRILIVGAGFAALAFARALDDRLAHSSRLVADATLVAASPFARLSPLLPGVVSGWVEPWHMLVPLQQSLRHVRWLPARARSLDPVAKRLEIEGAGSAMSTAVYDDIVLAVGDGLPVSAAQGVLPLRTIDDALRIRNRLADNVEAAAAEPSARRRRALLTAVVIGGSARGCAAAFECAAYLRCARELVPRVRPEEPRVVLVVAGELPCQDLAPHDNDLVRKLLDDVGIEVVARHTLQAAEEHHAVLESAAGGHEVVDAGAIVWAGGGAPAKLLAEHPGWLTMVGQARTDDALRVVGAQDVYALGACAAVPGRPGVTDPSPSPAQLVAMARSLSRALSGQAAATEAHRGPTLQAIAFDQHWGWAALGSRRLTGAAAACIARNIILDAAPSWSHRQAVRASWAIGRWSGAKPAPRLSPGQAASTSAR